MSKFRALLLAHHADPARRLRADRRRLAGRGHDHRADADAAPRAAAPAAAAGGGARPRPARPAPSTAASSAPRRACELPSRFTDGHDPPERSRASLYSIVGPVNVGTDCGGDPAAPLAGCQPATLTIQPGTRCLRLGGQRLSGRQPRLAPHAVGTAASPIIFTARANLAGTDDRFAARACGAASSCSAARRSATATPPSPGGSVDCQQVIEGTTSSLYGGASPNDNSGTLHFVQIRYSGFAIAPGNELQGLTLGGVGQLHHRRSYPGPQQLGRRHRDFRRPPEPQASW